MSEWKIITEFTVKGAKSLTKVDLNIRILPGDGPRPGFFTADIYPSRNPKPRKRHFGTWQFSLEEIDIDRDFIVSVNTDGVRLSQDGRELSPTEIIRGGLKEDGLYTVYLVLSESGTYAKLYETSYHRLLSFSGASLDPVEHWPDPFRRDLRTIQPEYWMMTVLRDKVRKFAGEMPAGSSVLDYGGGDAPYYPFFGARDLQYTNTDIFDGQFVDLVFKEGEPLPVENEMYDAVLCSHVLEHTPHPFKAVTEIHRVLRKGGRLLAAVPFAWENHNRPNDFWRFGRDGLYNLFGMFRNIKVVNDANTAQALIMLRNGHYNQSIRNKLLRETLIRWGNFRYRTIAARCKDDSLTCNLIVTATK